jgi:hypothetical protein
LVNDALGLSLEANKSRCGTFLAHGQFRFLFIRVARLKCWSEEQNFASNQKKKQRDQRPSVGRKVVVKIALIGVTNENDHYEAECQHE